MATGILHIGKYDRRRAATKSWVIMLRALAESAPPIKYKLFFISQSGLDPPNGADTRIGGAKCTGAKINFQQAQL
ncbi:MULTISPECIES: hypothetical protein [unclassified Sphingopyxis]|uniref:hypothetical protein n=1 Tax=unclassified Sphingopyxis TaxID=2614943 RepID=UPI000DC616B3|nr:MULTISPECIES: hypothetical protein [unclassified Sphingopyxis]BBB10043.1 maltose permease [Sphingopyxis sp. EG6]